MELLLFEMSREGDGSELDDEHIKDSAGCA